jgi:hypothetical protein
MSCYAVIREAGPGWIEGGIEIRSRLADDPWARANRLVITRIESWNLMVGAERLSGLAGELSNLFAGVRRDP